MELAVTAELRRLAAELAVDPDRLTALRELDVEQLRTLRAGLEQAVDDRYRPVFRRLERAARHLPAPLVARIATSSFSPLVLARTATELSTERASRILPHVPVDVIARCAPYMDPVGGRHLITALPPEHVLPVAERVVAAGDHAAMGRLVAALPGDILPQVVPLLQDGRGLVLVGFHCDDDRVLAEVIGHLDDGQVVAAGEATLAHGLEAELVDVLDRLPASHEQRLRDAAPADLVARLEARTDR